MISNKGGFVMISLNKILARMSIDYDSIHFVNLCYVYSYNELVENFDLDNCFLYNMFLDGLGDLNIDFVVGD